MNSKIIDVYDSEREEVLKNRIAYSLPVRIGNWNDDLYLEEEKQKLIKYKRDNCQLLAQKMRTVYQNLLKPVGIVKEMQFVNYGDFYHFKASEVADSLIPCPNKRSTGLYLAGLLNERDIDYSTHLTHGCSVTASPDKNSYVRNVFSFVSCDINRNGEAVNYGDDVYIKICESGTDKPLYIQCEQANTETFGSYLSVRLTQSPDLYCRFKVLHWEPQHRDETLGVGFPPRVRIIIKHTCTGQNLAVVTRHWIPTFFGPECMVVCRTFRDNHKMETAENIFMVMGKRDLDMNLIVRAAKGENIPTDLLE